MLKIDARSSRSTYTVFSTIFGVLALLSFFFGLKRHDWGAFRICLIVLSGFLLWVASFRLKVDDQKLIYRSLFSGTRSIAFSEIEKAEVGFGVNDSFGPFYRLTIYPSAQFGQRPIVINLKVFRRENIQHLSHVLADKLK